MASETRLRSRSAPPSASAHPRKPYPIAMSPLRALLLHKAHRQYKNATSHMPWLHLTDLGLSISDEIMATTAVGFIQGQRLEPHKLKVIPLQDEDVFPKCVGMNRAFNDEKLYPQHGDLKSAMFKRGRLAGAGVLRLQRTELVKKGEYKGTKVLEGEKAKKGTLKVSKTWASLNEELAEKMKQQLREVEERRIAARDARRQKGKTKIEAQTL